MNLRSAIHHTGALYDESGTVDWHKVIMAASEPWPVPTVEDLIATLNSLREIDSEHNGWITRQQFGAAKFWFPTGDQRASNFRQLFYHALADHSRVPVCFMCV